MDVTAVVMGKLPEPGRTKTRLVPPLTYVEAADVHAIFLRHTLERLATLRDEGVLGDVVFCFDPPDGLDRAMRKFRDLAVAFHPQNTGDLGRRLACEYADARAETAMLFLGADSPDVPAGHLKTAVWLLESDRGLVLGPCDDGGFWCMGVPPKVRLATITYDIDWSTGMELRQVRDRAKIESLPVLDAPAWSDVDRPADLATLYERLTRDERDDPSAAHLKRLLGNAVPSSVLTGSPE